MKLIVLEYNSDILYYCTVHMHMNWIWWTYVFKNISLHLLNKCYTWVAVLLYCDYKFRNNNQHKIWQCLNILYFVVVVAGNQLKHFLAKQLQKILNLCIYMWTTLLYPNKDVGGIQFFRTNLNNLNTILLKNIFNNIMQSSCKTKLQEKLKHGNINIVV